MSRPKVLSVVGNRPQYIKCAVVSRQLRTAFDETLLDTGQHYDHELAGVFFSELDLPSPNISLGVGSGLHGDQTARMLAGVEQSVIQERPAVVLVYGDTNSTLAAALAAAKLHVPVAHVESGLRSYDRAMPEEINRVVADHVADILFCPTVVAVENLRREGIVAGVHNVGDVMFDLACTALSPERERAALAAFGLQRGAYTLATLHRAANTDDPTRLAALLGAMAASPERVLFPVHPRTDAAIDRHGLRHLLGGNLLAVPPVGYFDSLALVKNARVVATDSGGLQKEAYFFATPCVTMREASEWVETVESGWNVLVGADGEALAAALADPPHGAEHPSFYGQGDAGERIVAVLSEYLEPATALAGRSA
jgi:UDP-N-acetylglucosamine 2-epimerase